MACRYEEEIYQRDGKVEECGCSYCPYNNLEQCVEVEPYFPGEKQMEGGEIPT